MGTYFGIDIETIFSTMHQRFRPEGADGVDTVLGYEIKGEGKWRLAVKDLQMEIEKVPDLDDCIAVLETDGETFVGMQIGKVEPVSALAANKLKIRGDQSAFTMTAKMFRKFTPPGREGIVQEELVALKRVISVGQRFATGPVMGKFLKALKEKKILAIKCPKCGRLQSPPREICAPCRVRNTDWVEIGPKGEMRMMEYCYYASPDPLTGETRETPYGAIGVLLDGCKGEEVFWHLLRPDQLDKVKMGIVMGDRVVHGSRLRPVWNENRTGSIFDIKYFELDE